MWELCVALEVFMPRLVGVASSSAPEDNIIPRMLIGDNSATVVRRNFKFGTVKWPFPMHADIEWREPTHPTPSNTIN